MKPLVSLLALLISGCALGVAPEDVASDFEGADTPALSPEQSSPTASFSSLGYTAVAAGEYHTLALRSDGRVFAAGQNAYGQLGNGTLTTTYTGAPTQVSGLSGVTSIAAGCSHSLALTSTGAVWGWGYNYRGQIGPSATTKQLTPVQVPGLPVIQAIAAGCSHSMALDVSGYVWTWGYNVYGQLGNGNSITTSTPTKLTSFLASAIDGGEAFSLALRTDGTVMAWGNNAYGQLARGNTTSTSTPLPTLLTGISGISAGANHGIAIKGANVLVWGDNAQGSLGTGSATPSLLTSPVAVGGIWWSLSPHELSAGRRFNLVGTTDGFGPALYFAVDWGSNDRGQLGIGTTTSTLQMWTGGEYSNAVFDFVQFGTNYETIALSAGGYHAAAIDNNGQVITWGLNDFGQLGAGSASVSSSWAMHTLFP